MVAGSGVPFGTELDATAMQTRIRPDGDTILAKRIATNQLHRQQIGRSFGKL